MKKIIIVIVFAILMAGVNTSCKVNKYPNKHHQNKGISLTKTKGFNKATYKAKGGHKFWKGKYWKIKVKTPLSNYIPAKGSEFDAYVLMSNDTIYVLMSNDTIYVSINNSDDVYIFTSETN